MLQQLGQIIQTNSNPQITTQSLLYYATIHITLNNLKKAISSYEQAISYGLDKTDKVVAVTSLGYIHKKLKQYDELKKYYTKAKSIRNWFKEDIEKELVEHLEKFISGFESLSGERK